MTVNVRTLRSSTREILSSVGRGEVVLIESRGRLCARIVPIQEKMTVMPVRSIAGLWKDNRKTADVRAFIRKLREPRHAR
ncbi:MAG: type II toxin-antitoxin system prevent-host-death family antitoxin [Candidatus Omnitrophica bacterium]|nr:type II toxin-antitoxin system prevent-host-death family antitoxin [Candidatus Omnitrophota bacterium]